MVNCKRKWQTGKLSVAALLAVSVSSAMAAGTWELPGCTEQTTNAGNFGNTLRCTTATTGAGPGVTISAWGSTATASLGYQTAFIGNYGTSGLGVKSQNDGLTASSPQHAIDNNPTSPGPDLLVLKFDSAVILDKVSLGWWYNDNDISVMAYTGTAANPVTASTTSASIVQGKSTANLTTSGSAGGWTLLESAGDPAPDTAATGGTSTTYSVNVSNPGVSSSFWLISAYASGFGGAAKDSLYDYVKLFSVATRDATSTKVPEPGSLALVSLAVLGAWSVRRRRSATVA